MTTANTEIERLHGAIVEKEKHIADYTSKIPALEVSKNYVTLNALCAYLGAQDEELTELKAKYAALLSVR